jgi:hypothetical protein
MWNYKVNRVNKLPGKYNIVLGISFNLENYSMMLFMKNCTVVYFKGGL